MQGITAARLHFGFVCAIFFATAAATTPAHAMLNISSRSTQNMDCAEGLCTPTASDATLNVKDLASMLRAGDLKIVANEPAVNIKITAPFGWTSKSRLTLSAAQSVIVSAAVVAAGRGAMEVDTNTSGVGGALTFFDGGSISFWNLKSALIINGVRYTLVDDIRILADDITTNPSGNYALAKNYDASQAGTFSHSPIPTVFSGRLEALGNEISNLSIATADNDNVGLFSHVGPQALIANLHLHAASMQTTNSAFGLGGIAALNEGTIAGGAVDGLISGGNQDGGIAVENVGTISSCRVNVSISNAYTAGGIVYGNTGGIDDCHSSGSVAAFVVAGGVAAISGGASIDRCSSSVAVSLSSSAGAAGGLVGRLSGGYIDSSFATGNVTTSTTQHQNHNQQSPGSYLGGLIGYSFPGSGISNSYATGIVSGHFSGTGHNSAVGGLVGYDAGGTAYVYSRGALSLNRGYIGGVLGYDASTERSNYYVYWDLDTSNVSAPSQGAGNIAYDRGIKGLSDSGLRHMPKGFNASVWAINPNINNGYPYLIANRPQ